MHTVQENPFPSPGARALKTTETVARLSASSMLSQELMNAGSFQHYIPKGHTQRKQAKMQLCRSGSRSSGAVLRCDVAYCLMLMLCVRSTAGRAGPKVRVMRHYSTRHHPPSGRYGKRVVAAKEMQVPCQEASALPTDRSVLSTHLQAGQGPKWQRCGLASAACLHTACTGHILTQRGGAAAASAPHGRV